MNSRIDAITLGVADLHRAREFYEDGLGFPVEQERGGSVTHALGAGPSKLVLCPWDSLAGDAGLSPESSGFRGFTLSYIVEEAHQVDEVLARAVRSGGDLSKPPRNAMWGYSAYVTAPDGCLWKIASSKRRPLIGRNRRAGSSEGDAKREIALTVGVADMKRARQFYKDGLGCPVKKDYSKFVSFGGDDGTPDLAMYTWDALAADAGVPATGSGFRGFSITHVVDSADDVDAELGKAARAGGRIVREPSESSGQPSGYYTDTDGYLWKIASSAQAARVAMPG